MQAAIVRPPARSFTRAINVWYTAEQGRPPQIDFELARRQHKEFTGILERLGIRVFLLESEELFPDGCFTQDPVVVADKNALILNMKEESRVGEEAAISNALAGLGVGLEQAEEGLADGGDLVVAEDTKTVFIGQSKRTDKGGFDTLSDFYKRAGYKAVAVPVTDCLHLGTGCTYLGNDHFMVCEKITEEARRTLRKYGKLIEVPREESCAANVIVIGKTVIMPEGFPETQKALRDQLFRIITTPLSEFEKADGSTTCLALLFNA